MNNSDRLVIVRWIDHYHLGDLVSRTEKKEAQEFETVGWLFSEDDLYYHVAPTRELCPEDRVDNVWSILKVAVISLDDVPSFGVMVPFDVRRST